jgi:hypothetical protein
VIESACIAGPGESVQPIMHHGGVPEALTVSWDVTPARRDSEPPDAAEESAEELLEDRLKNSAVLHATVMHIINGYTEDLALRGAMCAVLLPANGFLVTTGINAGWKARQVKDASNVDSYAERVEQLTKEELERMEIEMGFLSSRSRVPGRAEVSTARLLSPDSGLMEIKVQTALQMVEWGTVLNTLALLHSCREMKSVTHALVSCLVAGVCLCRMPPASSTRSLASLLGVGRGAAFGTTSTASMSRQRLFGGTLLFEARAVLSSIKGEDWSDHGGTTSAGFVILDDSIMVNPRWLSPECAIRVAVKRHLDSEDAWSMLTFTNAGTCSVELGDSAADLRMTTTIDSDVAAILSALSGHGPI